MDPEFQLEDAIAGIEGLVARAAHRRCVAVAVSGIDGSGKTTIVTALAQNLEARSLRTAVVNLDDWHTAPEVRFSSTDPGGHFYRHAYRFEELFELLVRPLRATRGLFLPVTLRQLPDNREFPYTYRFEDIDVLILEGIFLLKAELLPEYDYTIWIECSFDSAFARVIRRNQEGLPAEEIERDYRRIYFPAEELHMLLDAPRAHANMVVFNESTEVVGPRYRVPEERR